MKISEIAASFLQCPACKSKLKMQGSLQCVGCCSTYPVVDDVPILIHEANSVFRIEEITKIKKRTAVHCNI